MKGKLDFLSFYFGLVPLGLAILSVVFMMVPVPGVMEHIMIMSLLPLVVGGMLVGIFAMKRQREQELLTILLFPLSYTALLWAIFMLINDGFYGANSWLYYGIFHIALAPIFFFSMFMGEGRLFLYGPLAYELAFILGAGITLLIKRGRSAFKMKPLLTLLTIFVVGISTGSIVQWQRGQTILPASSEVSYSSSDLTPYDVTNTDNILPKLKGESTYTIVDAADMPILDGAEAAYPVYSAFANIVYKNAAQVQEQKNIISITHTSTAFERLLSDEIDIYFGAEPSKEQQEMAASEGKELVMTPIGKEAFVFFVNPDNQVDSLTVSQIKGIYSGKVKNWSDLGGAHKKIIAFQRPKNSGSQTLLEKIMGDTPIMKPLKEDIAEGMGGIIEQVADYRNYDNSIGYSFRFFATEMMDNPDIKLLAINGIAPDPANIADGSYPYTATLYAITVKENSKPTIKPFLEWMCGPQGQEIVERVGYIRAFE